MKLLLVALLIKSSYSQIKKRNKIVVALPEFDCCFKMKEDEKNHVLLLLNGLRSQRLEGQYCDVILKILGHSYSVHSCILSLVSPYLHSLIDQHKPRPYSEHSPQIIELELNQKEFLETDDFLETSLESVQLILDYIYTGKIEINKSNVGIVQIVAKLLELRDVEECCQKILQVQNPVTLSNISKSIRQKSNRLKRKITHGHDGFRMSKIVSSNGTVRTNCKSVITKALQPKNEQLKRIRKKEVKKKSNIPDSENNSANQQHSFVNSPVVSCSKCFHSVSDPKIKSGKCYKCHSCGFMSVKVKKLLNHLKETQHDDNICSLCNFEADTNEAFWEHLKRHDDKKPFFCVSCELRFQTRTALSLHLPKHSSQKPYVCMQCNKGFKWKHALQSHMIVHTREKQHLCDQCGYRTAHQSSFKAHCLLHTGNTFKCPQAGCTFQAIRKQNLQQHLITHTKEKPYQCEVCGQAFSLVKNLRRHARIHNASENLIYCEDCAFSTTRIDKMKEHSRRHHQDKSEITCSPPITDMNNTPITTDLVPNLFQVVVEEDLNDISDCDKTDKRSIINAGTSSQSSPESHLPLSNDSPSQVLSYTAIQMTQVLLPAVYAFSPISLSD